MHRRGTHTGTGSNQITVATPAYGRYRPIRRRLLERWLRQYGALLTARSTHHQWMACTCPNGQVSLSPSSRRSPQAIHGAIKSSRPRTRNHVLNQHHHLNLHPRSNPQQRVLLGSRGPGFPIRETRERGRLKLRRRWHYRG